MSGEQGRGGLCLQCGRETGPQDAPTAPYCAQCAAERAESDLTARAAQRERDLPDGQRRARAVRQLRTGVLWVLGVVALGVLAWQAPQVYSATLPATPIRHGVQSTNQKADDCISNLWEVSSNLSEGKSEPAAGLTCPASGKPYETSRSDTIVVSCPNPAEHDLESLSIDSVSLVPEVK